MKRRLVSLLLCTAILAVGILATGCATTSGSNTAVTETGDGTSILKRSSMTLTLWVPTYEGTTDKALDEVEEAINKITQAEYDTAIKLYGIPSAEYEAAVKKQIEDITARKAQEDQAAIDRRKAEREAAKRGETYVPDSTEADNFQSSYDLIVNGGVGYPHVEKNQMDIFLIRGNDDYMYYINNMYLQSLDEEIASTSKALKSYIYTDFLDYAMVDGSTYAIPNNHAVGEYKYLLVNKKLVSELGYNSSDLLSLNNCKGFINSVAEKYPDVTPVYGTIDPTYIQYWSGENTDTFSVLASRVRPGDKPADVVMQNIFDISNYNDYVYLQKLYTEKGYISADDNGKEFGVGIIKGTPDDIKKYSDDYYVNIFESPEGTAADYCQAMFGVSTFTKSTSRSMEIITRLSTQEDIRTILQYGVEGKHWKVDEEDDSVIIKLSDDYKMNLIETGNVYMTYPGYGIKKDWSAAKEQNLASFLPATYLLKNYSNEDNADLIKNFNAFCQQINEKVKAMSADEFLAASTGSLKNEVSSNEYFQKLSYVPSAIDAQQNKTEETGWYAHKSIAGLWDEVLQALAKNK